MAGHSTLKTREKGMKNLSTALSVPVEMGFLFRRSLFLNQLGEAMKKELVRDVLPAFILVVACIVATIANLAPIICLLLGGLTGLLGLIHVAVAISKSITRSSARTLGGVVGRRELYGVFLTTFGIAFATFAYLYGRIDGRIDQVLAELNGRIDQIISLLEEISKRVPPP